MRIWSHHLLTAEVKGDDFQPQHVTINLILNNMNAMVAMP
jgi:hypothetical protein